MKEKRKVRKTGKCHYSFGNNLWKAGFLGSVACLFCSNPSLRKRVMDLNYLGQLKKAFSIHHQLVLVRDLKMQCLIEPDIIYTLTNKSLKWIRRIPIKWVLLGNQYSMGFLCQVTRMSECSYQMPKTHWMQRVHVIIKIISESEHLLSTKGKCNNTFTLYNR